MSRIKIPAGESFFRFIRNEGYNSMYHVHQILWRLFPNEPGASRDFLFRTEIQNNRNLFYLVSKKEPSGPMIDYLEIETKHYVPVIRHNENFIFTIRLNPTVSKKREGKKNSIRHDVYMNAKKEGKKQNLCGMELNQYIESKVKEWFITRTLQYGFYLNKEKLFFDGYFQHSFYKFNTKSRIRFSSIDYKGILTVDDPIKFKDALFSGIGKSKAFGCGLLLIKRA